VGLPDQAIGQREPFVQAREAVVERGDVVGHLDDVVQRHARRFVELEQEQVGERGLRALDLRRQHRLLAHVGVEEQGLVRQEGGDAVEPADGQHRRLEQLLQVAVEGQGRAGWQRRGDEGPQVLAADARDLVSARLAAPHPAAPWLSKA